MSLYSNFQDLVSVIKQNFTRINTTLNGKQNTLTAGTNITITNDVISATGGGASLPVASADKDVIYWDDTNQTYVAGAITNVIPNGDNLSY